MTNFTSQIHPRRGDYHSIYYVDSSKIEVGRGYIPKVGKRAGKICLLCCPDCRQENSLINSFTGICPDCGFDANKEEK